MSEPDSTYCHALPGQPLKWGSATQPFSRIWIDAAGGQHGSRYVHGSTFLHALSQSNGAEPSPDDLRWLDRKVGVPDEDNPDEDNPGWQWNKLATDRLGWIRVSAHRDRNAATFSVSLDEELVTREALLALQVLLQAETPESRVELGLEEWVENECSRDKALKQVAEILEVVAERDAEAALPRRPVYTPPRPQSDMDKVLAAVARMNKGRLPSP